MVQGFKCAVCLRYIPVAPNGAPSGLFCDPPKSGPELRWLHKVPISSGVHLRHGCRLYFADSRTRPLARSQVSLGRHRLCRPLCPRNRRMRFGLLLLTTLARSAHFIGAAQSPSSTLHEFRQLNVTIDEQLRALRNLMISSEVHPELDQTSMKSTATSLAWQKLARDDYLAINNCTNSSCIELLGRRPGVGVQIEIHGLLLGRFCSTFAAATAQFCNRRPTTTST